MSENVDKCESVKEYIDRVVRTQQAYLAVAGRDQKTIDKAIRESREDRKNTPNLKGDICQIVIF